MNFHWKNVKFEKMLKKGRHRHFWIFLCQMGIDDHPKIWLKNSKTMSHNSDVIKIHANEGTQKTLSGNHFGLALKIADFFVFSVSNCSNTHAILIDFHRTLSEGQEIDIRSKFSAGDHSESFDWNYSFLGSYHSTWSQGDVQSPFDVDRLISHVIRSKTFFHLLLS